MAERVFDFDSIWLRGMKSDCDPGLLPEGYYFNGINVLNVGGMLSCRPGHNCIIELPAGNLQGATLFRPRIGIEQMVVAIDGVIYVSDYPFKNFRRLLNVLFPAHIRQIFWAQAEQSARRITTDIDSAIEIIQTRNVLFMQDGGTTAPAYYDGTESGHIRDNAFETPIGGPMKWIGDRLWVAKGNQVFASDIANPFSFREQIYLGGNISFFFDSDVTALAATPSIEFPQLVVFTTNIASLLQANIRERALWLTTDGFQRELFAIGCESQRSVINHFGQLLWFSRGGIQIFDAASISRITARQPTRDNEMHISKTDLYDDLSTVAGAAFGDFILMSVPSADSFNRHTWVLNSASFESLTDDSGPSWSGFWIGTRPVEWVYGDIAGKKLIYHVSTDEDGNNRLWQSFIPNRLDNGCPITWGVETRGYFGLASKSGKPPGLDTRICYADIAMTGIAENCDLGVFYAGSLRGAYKPIMTRVASVTRGMIDSEVILNSTDIIFALKPQSRIWRTEEIRFQADAETGSCPVEREVQEEEDESFQLLIVGHGPATIRWIRAFSQPRVEDQSADGEACQPETDFNAVSFDGSGTVSNDSEEDARAEAVAKLFDPYFSNKSAVVTQGVFTAVGMGNAESIVSQSAADRVAGIVAIRQAESELARVVPPVLSVGL